MGFFLEGENEYCKNENGKMKREIQSWYLQGFCPTKIVTSGKVGGDRRPFSFSETRNVGGKLRKLQPTISWKIGVMMEFLQNPSKMIFYIKM